MKTFFGLLVMGMILISTASQAGIKTIAEIGSDANSILRTMKNGDVIRFVSGDVLSLNVEVQGDLLETKQAVPSFIQVKRDFYLKDDQNEVLLSLDGADFKPIRNLLRGNISAGASASGNGGAASDIQILFGFFLK